MEKIKKGDMVSVITGKERGKIGVVLKTVKKGEDVSLVGFGTFARAKRAARTGVNPATGEKIKIPAKKVPKFRPGKAWKDMF